MPARLTVEDTPNPHAFKFTADRVLNPGPTRSYRSPPPPEAPPEVPPEARSDRSDNHIPGAALDALAAALFAAGPVASVMIVGDFVTVNKKPSARWKTLRPKIEATIAAHLDREPDTV